MLKNLSHAVISNIKISSNGTGYTADVKYDGTALELNKDFKVIQLISDKVGAVDLAFIGQGDYAGYQLKSTPVVPQITDLSKAKVNLKKAAVNYNGRVQKPAVKSVTLDGRTVPSSAYTVSISAKNPKNAGTYTVKVTGKADENYKGSATAKYTIKQVANTISFNGRAVKKAVTYSVKKKTVDKKAPKGKYKFTVTVAANSNWKKTSSKVITLYVK